MSMNLSVPDERWKSERSSCVQILACLFSFWMHDCDAWSQLGATLNMATDCNLRSWLRTFLCSALCKRQRTFLHERLFCSAGNCSLIKRKESFLVLYNPSCQSPVKHKPGLHHLQSTCLYTSWVSQSPTCVDDNQIYLTTQYLSM